MTFSFGASPLVGLDIGSSMVYVSVAHKSGRDWTVSGLLKIPRAELPRDDDAALAREIHRRMTAAGFPVKNIVLSLPAESSILRYIMIPPAPPWRIDLLVKYEVEDMVKRTGSELTSGWRKQTVGGSGAESPLLMVLGKEPDINGLLFNLRQAGLGIVSVIPPCESLLRAWRLLVEQAPGEGAEAMVSIGEKSTQVVITLEGELLYARQAFFGGTHFTEALKDRVNGSPEQIEQLKRQSTGLEANSSKRDFSEALRRPAAQLVNIIKGALSWANSQVDSGKLKLDRMVLTGGAAELRHLDRYLKLTMGVPVVRATVTKGVTGEAQGSVSQSVAGFLPAMGLSIMDLKDPEVVEVLPQKEQARRKFRQETVFLYSAIALLTAFLLFQLVAGLTQSWKRSDYLNNLRAQVQELDKGFKNINETRKLQTSIKARLGALDQHIQANGFYGKLTHFLGSELPNEVYLLSVRQWPMNEQSPVPAVEIEGMADDKNQQAVALIDALDTLLRSQPFVGDVSLKAEAMNIEKDKNAIRFVMKVSGTRSDAGKG